MPRISHLSAAVLAVALASPPAGFAHVMLAPAAAAPGASYVGAFRVTHGCAGSATIALRVEIPPEVTGVKPQAKAGWTLDVAKTPSPAGGSESGSEGGRAGAGARVLAITWRGGVLSDDAWDEFGILARLPEQEGPLYFPTVQTCASGETRWTDIPAPGRPWRSAPHPAPVLLIGSAGGAPMDMSPPHAP